MLKKYFGWFGDFSLNPEIDFYGDQYWQAVASKKYEPDTMIFLENSIDSNTDFLDVGAATGAMSLIAASLGARVLAFEPVPKVFSIATQHINSNPDLADKILIKNEAISNVSGRLYLNSTINPKILSTIAFASHDKTSSEDFVSVASLEEQILNFHLSNRKLVIKIDIEGAEWKLLSDSNVLRTLKNYNALVLLAIHPGFYRPFKKFPFGLQLVSKFFWQMRNAMETYNYFSNILKYAEVRRTNLEIIVRPRKCVMLMFGGYFEFILDFTGK